jgi:hypothetical protein
MDAGEAWVALYIAEKAMVSALHPGGDEIVDGRSEEAARRASVGLLLMAERGLVEANLLERYAQKGREYRRCHPRARRGDDVETKRAEDDRRGRLRRRRG